MPSFRLNRFPKASLNEGDLIARGIAPSIIPWGQIYLQKYGGITSYLSPAIKAKAIISENNIIYFIYLRGFNFFVENFLVGILCSKSPNQPMGQKNPQISLATITPKNAIIPKT